MSKNLIFYTSVAMITLVAAVFFLLNPAQAMEFQYYRRDAEELATALETKGSAKVGRAWSVEQRPIVISVEKPGEDALRIEESYSALVAGIKGPSIVVKPPRSEPYTLQRKVEAYSNGTHFIVALKPVVSHYTREEYGRTVHVVTIVLVKASGLASGAEFRLISTSMYEYLRTYDAAGIVSVKVNGAEALRITVDEGQALRLIIVREQWGA